METIKYLRFISKGKERCGILEGDCVREISGNFFEEFAFTGEKFVLDEVKLIAPCNPSKVVAVGLNYADHVKEFGSKDTPSNPTLFIKLPHTVIGPGETILIPRGATRVDYEAELAAVIGRTCRNADPEEASSCVFGVTCLNDVTERDMQKADGQWTRAKNFETFCPIGPYIVTGINYSALDIKLFLNGEIRQSSNTRNLIWGVNELISFISHIMPLYPGDVVTTGTPSGVGPMKDGDIVEVVIEGIGTLKNRVSGSAP